MSMIADLLAQNDRDLTLTFSGALDPLIVVADRNLMGQVISVLLTNALNYTPSGGEIMVQTQKAIFLGKAGSVLVFKTTAREFLLMSNSVFLPGSTAEK